MRCEAVQELFSEIYDQVAEGQALLVEHLQTCRACMQEFMAYSQMLDELRNLPIPELPPGFHKAAMNRIQAQMPQSDNDIDKLMEEIETRKRLRDVRRKNQPVRKTASIARRWAGVAAAACLLLVCLWAVRTLDLPGRHSYNDEYMPVPQSAAGDWDISMGYPVDSEAAPPLERRLPNDSTALPEYAHDHELFADEAPSYDYAFPAETAEELDAQALENWDMLYEDNAYIDFSPAMEEFEYDGLAATNDAWGGDDTISHRWATGYSGYEDDLYNDMTFASETPIGAVYGVLMDDIIDPLLAPPLVHGGEGSRAWIIAIFAGVIPLCIALGFVLRSIHKNRLSKKIQKG